MGARIAPYTLLLGRILLSQIFIVNGVLKIKNWSSTLGYMTSKGLPATPILLAIAILFELGGGLVLLIGPKARYGALALIVFMVPTTIMLHNFWLYQGMDLKIQMTHFMKNLAILGGLVLVATSEHQSLRGTSNSA